MKKKGLTLIELMVAVAILLILSTLIMPVGNMYVWREQEFELKEDLAIMRKSIENYKQKFEKYPLKGEMNQYGNVVDLIENSLIRKGYLRRIPVNPFKNLRIKELYSLWEVRNSREDIWVSLNNARKFYDGYVPSIQDEQSFGPLNTVVGYQVKDSNNIPEKYWATSPKPIVTACSLSNINIEDIIEGDAYRIDYVNGKVYANIGNFYDRDGDKYNLVGASLTIRFVYNVNIFDIFNIRHSKRSIIQKPMFQLSPDDFYFTW